jgi:2-polyprenyl-6-methoxyphenol hydroxylase-like FAD-dependent oxidoreductase
VSAKQTSRKHFADQPTRRYDVAVIGDGPAGALAAALLADAHAVALIGRDRPSRLPIELLSGRGRRLLLAATGYDIATEPFAETVEESVSHWHSEGAVQHTAIYSPWGAAITLERQPFDRWLRALARTAGAEHVLGHGRAITRSTTGWQIEVATTAYGSVWISARQLVLATGQTSRAWAAEQQRTLEQLAIWTRVWTNSARALHITRLSGGWAYALPSPTGDFLIAICLPDNGAVRRAAIARLWRTQLGAGPSPFDRCSVTSSPLKACRSRTTFRDPAAGNDWLAIGDAAFSHDPLSGQGLEWAIESAQFVCEALASPRAGTNYALEVATRRTEHWRVAAELRPSMSSNRPEADVALARASPTIGSNQPVRYPSPYS